MSQTQMRKPRSVKGFGKIIMWEDTGENPRVTLDIYTYPSANINHDASNPYQVSLTEDRPVHGKRRAAL